MCVCVGGGGKYTLMMYIKNEQQIQRFRWLGSADNKVLSF